MTRTQIEYREAAFQIKKDALSDDGTFEGYASVFGVVDLGDDVVQRGAFSKSLGARRAKMLWQHDTTSPIGVWDDVREDDKGLFVKGRLLSGVQKGREAIELMRAGAIDSMSIGFRTVHADYTGEGVRKLMELELHEISLVTFPMLPDAMVTAVKSIKTERDFEKFLREAGYSKSQAVAIASHGFKAVDGQREADNDTQRDAEVKDKDELTTILNRLKENLRG